MDGMRWIRVLARRWVGLAALLTAVFVGGTPLLPEAPPPLAGASPALWFGTLGSSTAHVSTDAAAGIQLATVTVGWNMWEPKGPQVSSSWASYIRSEISTYESHGQYVIVELGLQYTPSWVLDLPDGQLVNQYGQQSGTPNYEWNPTVQADMTSFVSSVVSQLASVHPAAYRIGLSTSGEMLYGNNSAGSWWSGGEAQASTPMPGWVPGDTTWNGSPVTPTQAAGWYSWYLNGLVDAEHAEIAAIRNAGFSGHLMLLMPGDGTSPSQYSRRLAADLGQQSSLDVWGTMNTGAVWWLQLPELMSLGGLGSNDYVDITSVGDGTGWGACQPADTSVSLAAADPWKSGWDDTRWLTYLARTNGFGVTGENPGGQNGSQLAAIVGLARSCQLHGLFWQNDNSLYSGNGATIADYQAAIHS